MSRTVPHDRPGAARRPVPAPIRQDRRRAHRRRGRCPDDLAGAVRARSGPGAHAADGRGDGGAGPAHAGGPSARPSGGPRRARPDAAAQWTTRRRLVVPGEVAEHEIAIGAVGRFWKPAIEWYDVSAMTPEGFAAFDEAGWGRIAASLSLRPYGTGRTLVSYEARTALGDADSARRFARYWVVVRPFARHIMRAALATVAADAEARPR